MASLRDEIISKLWAAHNSGKRPIAIRMAHKTLNEMMCNEDYLMEEDDIDCDENGWTFQTLPIRIDSWHSSPFIEVE